MAKCKVNVAGGKKPTGNAQPSEVLATKTFMNADGEQVGTMINRATGDYAASALISSGNHVYLTIPDDAYYGSISRIRGYDIDFDSANIKSGVSMFGKVGTLEPKVSPIKSIQRGTFSFHDVASASISISSVDRNSAIVRISYKGGGAPSRSAVGAFLHSTSIIININSASSLPYPNPKDVYWEVIEFNDVKSVQTGQVTLVGTNTSNVSTVNTSKSMLFCSHWTNSSSADTGLDIAHFVQNVLSPTQVYFENRGTQATFVKWQLVEFN